MLDPVKEIVLDPFAHNMTFILEYRTDRQIIHNASSQNKSIFFV